MDDQIGTCGNEYSCKWSRSSPNSNLAGGGCTGHIDYDKDHETYLGSSLGEETYACAVTEMLTSQRLVEERTSKLLQIMDTGKGGKTTL